MKKITLLLLVALCLKAELTKAQVEKLQNPVVKEKNSTLVIEEYGKMIFVKPQFFAKQNLSEVITKTYATMPKGTINKEQFIAIASTMSDQMAQSVFMGNPDYAQNLKSGELLTSKPMKKPELFIELHFTKEGVNGKMYSVDQKVENFIPYEELFITKMR